MKISSLLHGFNPDLEERRRSQQRKEVGEVYKKHAKYADASKNPILKALEDLLSGKTEKELHQTDAATRSQPAIVEGEELLELPEVISNDAYSVRATTPTQQAITDQTGEQMEQSNAEEAVPFNMPEPEKFQKDFARNPEEKTVFAQELEKMLFQRTFKTATQVYSSHIAMVNNGYYAANEPISP